jgi:hypothetical protein
MRRSKRGKSANIGKSKSAKKAVRKSKSAKKAVRKSKPLSRLKEEDLDLVKNLMSRPPGFGSACSDK